MSDVFRHRFTVRVVLESPLASQGLTPKDIGLDTPLARDHQGRLIIPGTLLQGVLLCVLDEMATAMEGQAGPVKLDGATLAGWFGEESGDVFDADLARPFDPRRARLRVGDLVCETDERPGTLTRIQIDPERGSVESGMLQVVEQPFAYGAHVHFRGELVFYGTVAEADQMERAVGRALKFIPAPGGVKTAGFGRVAQGIVLEPAEPFLVDADLLGGNVFVGRSVIPGGAIKGCLARMLTLTGELEALADDLARVLISHAFPTWGGDGGRRPRQMPAAVVKATIKANGQPEDWFFDFFNDDHKKRKDIVSPLAFDVDWKGRDYGLVKGWFHWPADPRSHVRTRTAIDPQTGGSKEEKLFSYRAVVPEGLRWRFIVDQGGATDAGYAKIVAALLSGLDFLGKTGVEAKCGVAQDPGLAAKAEAKNGLWRVTLQTPAWLLWTKAFTRDKDGGAVDLKEQYLAYWRKILTWRWGERVKDLDLEFLARQYWAGGYLGRRYPVTGNPSDYKPYLLTRTGAVFQMLIDGPSLAEQAEFFAGLARRGLPVVAAESLDQPELWEKYPYVPENGYGEVRVDWADADLLQGGKRDA